MNKKPRWISVGLAVVLCLSLSVSAAADGITIYFPLVMRDANTSGETVISLGDPITVSGPGAVVSGSTVTIVAGGRYRAAGVLADGMLAVNTTGEVALTLDGVSITHTTGPALHVINAAKLSLVLADGASNTLVDGLNYSNTALRGVVFSADPLEISGRGRLFITGNYRYGIGGNDSIAIYGGEITIAAVGDGIHAAEDIVIAGGVLRITQANDGIESEAGLVVEDGELTLTVADDGIVSEAALTVNGGDIVVLTGVEGIESKDALTINNGAVTIAVSDDGLNATNRITINGGEVFLDADGDAIDSNGELHVNGGVTVALGGASPDSGLDCGGCQALLNGGIVVATGGANTARFTDSAQRVLVMGARPVGDVIHIARDDGTDVLTFRVTKAYESMIFTSPALLPNRFHTAYTGGSVSGGTDFHGLYTGATYSGGSIWATFTTNSVVTHVGITPPPPSP
jgi:hypothetical protein